MGGCERARNLALAAIAIAFSVGAVELGLRVFSPQVYRQPHVWQHDAEIGWAHRPGSHGRLVQPEFDVEVRINAEGLRGPDRPAAKPPGTYRLLVLGDSFAEGWGVAEEQTFAARLEALLGARLGHPVEVMNLGVAGYGSDQALLAFARDGVRRQPDRAILLVFVNDLWDNTNANGLGGRGGTAPKPLFVMRPEGGLALTGVPVPRTPNWDQPERFSSAWWHALPATVAERSHVAALVARLVTQGLPPAQAQRYYGRLYGPPSTPEQAPAWALFDAILGAFVQVAREAGAKPLVVFIPERLAIEDSAWETFREQAGLRGHLERERPETELMRIAAAHQIPFLDLGPVFREHGAEGPFYWREGHWTAAGHALAAETVDRFLAAEDASPSAAPTATR
jgi:lysophospholipase L1-like esterase